MFLHLQTRFHKHFTVKYWLASDDDLLLILIIFIFVGLNRMSDWLVAFVFFTRFEERLEASKIVLVYVIG